MANKKTEVQMFDIEEMEIVDFCRVLGQHGLKFEISELRSVIRPKDANKKRYFRVFTVYAPKKQMNELLKELGVN